MAHGVPLSGSVYLLRKSPLIVKSVFMLLIFFVALVCLLALGIRWNSRMASHRPVQEVIKPVESLDFPYVTVCPPHPVRSSDLVSSGIGKRLTQPQQTPPTIEEIYSTSRNRSASVIASCMLNGKTCPENSWKDVWTSRGICHQFRTNQPFRDSGSRFSLDLIINGENYDKPFTQLGRLNSLGSSSDQVKIFLGEEKDFVSLDEHVVVLNPNTENDISVSVRDIIDYAYPCSYGKKMSLKMDWFDILQPEADRNSPKEYTQSKCLVENLASEMRIRCRCRLPHAPNRAEARDCKVGDYWEQGGERKCLRNTTIVTLIPDLERNCHTACNRRRFEPMVTSHLLSQDSVSMPMVEEVAANAKAVKDKMFNNDPDAQWKFRQEMEYTLGRLAAILAPYRVIPERTTTVILQVSEMARSALQRLSACFSFMNIETCFLQHDEDQPLLPILPLTNPENSNEEIEIESVIALVNSGKPDIFFNDPILNRSFSFDELISDRLPALREQMVEKILVTKDLANGAAGMDKLWQTTRDLVTQLCCRTIPGSTSIPLFYSYDENGQFTTKELNENPPYPIFHFFQDSRSWVQVVDPFERAITALTEQTPGYNLDIQDFTPFRNPSDTSMLANIIAFYKTSDDFFNSVVLPMLESYSATEAGKCLKSGAYPFFDKFDAEKLNPDGCFPAASERVENSVFDCLKVEYENFRSKCFGNFLDEYIPLMVPTYNEANTAAAYQQWGRDMNDAISVSQVIDRNTFVRKLNSYCGKAVTDRIKPATERLQVWRDKFETRLDKRLFPDIPPYPVKSMKELDEEECWNDSDGVKGAISCRFEPHEEFRTMLDDINALTPDYPPISEKMEQVRTLLGLGRLSVGPSISAFSKNMVERGEVILEEIMNDLDKLSYSISRYAMNVIHGQLSAFISLFIRAAPYDVSDIDPHILLDQHFKPPDSSNYHKMMNVSSILHPLFNYWSSRRVDGQRLLPWTYNVSLTNQHASAIDQIFQYISTGSNYSYPENLFSIGYLQLLTAYFQQHVDQRIIPVLESIEEAKDQIEELFEKEIIGKYRDEIAEMEEDFEPKHVMESNFLRARIFFEQMEIRTSVKQSTPPATDILMDMGAAAGLYLFLIASVQFAYFFSRSCRKKNRLGNMASLAKLSHPSPPTPQPTIATFRQSL